MAGHSKWANRKHRKARQDAIRAKMFTKLSKEIIIAAKQGGGDPETNFRLRLAIDKAKENNMPNDNIERAVLKGTGDLDDDVNYEEFSYEGYGAGGVAIFVDIATDNRNRTAADIRYLFNRHGGSMGQNGCVAWMFERKGVLYVDSTGNSQDMDDILMDVIEAGGQDLETDGDSYIVYTDVENFVDVKDNLKAKKYNFSSSGLEQVPKNLVNIEGESAQQVLDLIDALEDNDDVQNVYANLDLPDE